MGTSIAKFNPSPRWAGGAMHPLHIALGMWSAGQTTIRAPAHNEGNLICASQNTDTTDVDSSLCAAAVPRISQT